MNVYMFEMKTQLRKFLLWTAGIVAVYMIFMVGFYPIFQENTEFVAAAYKGFSPAFAGAFGMDVADIFSYGGFFSFGFNYIALMGAIMASSLAISAFAREKRAGCADFILTKPMSRTKVFAAKLLACLTYTVADCAVFMFTAAVCKPDGDGSTGKLLLAAFSLFPTELVFLSLGIAFSAFTKKIRSVSGAATSIGFTGFILSALYGILKEDALRYIAPLRYFDPGSVFSSGHYELSYTAAGIALAAACMILSFAAYTRGDVRAV